MNSFVLQTARKATLSNFFRLVPRAALSALAEEVDEVAEMLKHAAAAQEEFRKLSQEETDRIFDAVAHEANRHRVPLAKLAIQETKMGCFEDKIMKNGLACELIHDRYRPLKTCGLIASDPTHGKYTYAFPVGPVCAITPVTNPTSTAIAKSLVMAKTRNAGIVLPHHRASESTYEAVRICHDAGVRAGAPDGWVQCVEHPSRDVKKQVLNSDEIKLILATGGPGIIRACKEAGKPALSGGAGNAPVLVDELADLKTACSFIVLGKTFDNGMTCAAEQSIVVVHGIYDEFKGLLQDRGVYFLNSYDRMLLSSFIHKDGHINPDIVGQTAAEIAKRAGIRTKLPKNTVVLGTEESIIGPENPLSGEKLSPVISLFRAKNFAHGVNLCQALAMNGGVGHTAGIYTSEDGRLSARVQQFTESIPVGRIIVNAPTVLTAIGTAFNFNMDPSFTLGVGTQAGSSLSTSLSPSDLINKVTVAERQPHMEWYHLPPNIFFNRGCLEEAIQQCAMPDETGNRCRRAMVVTDMGIRKCGYLARILNALKKEGFEVNVFDQVQPDPNIELVRHGVQMCQTFKPDIIFCLGGGSAIDAGKYIRVQYEHPKLALEDATTRFIEIRKRTMKFPRLGSKIRKLVAIPTTSGTGSEVSPFTVITDDDGRKFPIASYRLTPDIAICDSTLTDSLPKSLIANAGIDAVTHAIESYVSVLQTDFTKQQSMAALELLFMHLPLSYESGTPTSRDAVHRGATLAGIALSNAFVGVCHSLSHTVGAEFHLPHGLANGVLLPHVIRYNASESPTKMCAYPSYTHPKAGKQYSDIANAIGASAPTPDGLIEEIMKLLKILELPTTFKDAGVDRAQFFGKLTMMAENAFDDQCTPANPRFPLVEELKEILAKAYDGDVSLNDSPEEVPLISKET